MKKTWGVGMMMLLPLTLQAMEGDESFKTTLKNRPPSHKRSLARSPTTTDFKQYNLQDMSEPVEVTKESVEVIKVELLPTPKQGPKTSKRGGATKNNSLLKKSFNETVYAKDSGYGERTEATRGKSRGRRCFRKQ
jgi:hypothetical protein